MRALIIIAIMMTLIYPNADSLSCSKNARLQRERFQGKGYEVRLGVGTFNGTKHMWCEWYDPSEEKWRLAPDTSQPMFGHQLGWYRGYEVKNYVYKEKEGR